jgi:5'-deoxynucleotidase YfbR-like HD superfamily hydrolase
MILILDRFFMNILHCRDSIHVMHSSSICIHSYCTAEIGHFVADGSNGFGAA